MSKIYYKHTFEYDDNCGNLVKTTIYQKVNDITNTEEFYNEDANIIHLQGPINYMIMLGMILRGIPVPSIETTSITYSEFNKIFNSSSN